MLNTTRNIMLKVSTILLVTTHAFALPESHEKSPTSHCLCLAERSAPEFLWTAFKFSEKTGVGGRFSDTRVNFRHDAHTIEELVASGEFTASVNTVSTGNPIRDETLRKSFFSLFSRDQVRGHVVKVDEDTFVMHIEMNGQEKPVTFRYKLTNDGIFSASGSLDMLDFGLQQAHESIHQACEKLHTGPDGVSKTWTDVQVNVKATVRMDCGCS